MIAPKTAMTSSQTIAVHAQERSTPLYSRRI